MTLRHDATPPRESASCAQHASRINVRFTIDKINDKWIATTEQSHRKQRAPVSAVKVFTGLPAAVFSSQAARYIALHCGKAVQLCKVNGKGQTLTPSERVTSKTLILLDIHEYVHEIYTGANFHFISFSGSFSTDR